jgi:hypothetical protein
MLCLEVVINGERRVVAGDSLAERLWAEVTAYPGSGITSINVDGDVLPEGQPPADARWMSAALSVGDSVLIRVIDASEATAPTLRRFDPSVKPDPTDEIPFVCSFCGKTHHETDRMVSSTHAIICHECIRRVSEMIKDSP